MPVPHHADLEFVAGDDWNIGAALLRPDGTAYDLSNATVVWMRWRAGPTAGSIRHQLYAAADRGPARRWALPGLATGVRQCRICLRYNGELTGGI